MNVVITLKLKKKWAGVMHVIKIDFLAYIKLINYLNVDTKLILVGTLEKSYYSIFPVVLL